MQIYEAFEQSSLKLVINTYIYQIAPVRNKLTAISSDDIISFFDPVTLQTLSGDSGRHVHPNVTCLSTGGTEDDDVFTAGRDGMVRSWDWRTPRISLKFPAGSSPLLSLALDLPSHRLATGAELTQSQAKVQLWYQDSIFAVISSKLRLDIGTTGLLRNLSWTRADFKKLSFHPLVRNRLLSGSTDGLLNVYDIEISNEEEALVQVMNHGSSIAHAGYLPDQQIFALSHDEVLSIYPPSAPEDPDGGLSPSNFGDLRPILGCDYCVDLLVSGNNATLAAGSHNRQQVNLVSLSCQPNWVIDVDQQIQLHGGHGEDIVRSTYVDFSVRIPPAEL
ncbi:hypothetical protein MMC25_003283 [Agyrium rufum]|nr:hypothetical protein [Agyrium rufum]